MSWQSWVWPLRGLGLVLALIVCKYVRQLSLVGAAIILFSVYNALELWRFDRVAGVEKRPVPQQKLFNNDPHIDREVLAQALASRGEEWAHSSHRVLVWNPRRGQLELFASINPLVAIGLWCGIYGDFAAVLTSAALLGFLLKFQDALDLCQQLTLESCQKQTEHAIWKHNTTKRSPASRMSIIGKTTSAGLASPAPSGQNSPVNMSFGSFAGSLGSSMSSPNSSFNSSFSSSVSSLHVPPTRHTSTSYGEHSPATLRPLSCSPIPHSPGQSVPQLVPRQNPRRTSSYRASSRQTLEVPEMAPRRVASMASRDNMRTRFQQAV